jgi:hypothetical protein
MNRTYFSKHKIFFLLIVTTLNCSCLSFFEDEKFTLTKTAYSGNELKIDGYFYIVYASKDSVNPRNTGITFLYNNGIALTSRLSQLSFLNNSENGEFNNYVQNNPNVWALYSIENDNIKIEAFKPMGGIGTPMYIKEGKILNDTTFHLVREYASYNTKDTRELDETIQNAI